LAGKKGQGVADQVAEILAGLPLAAVLIAADARIVDANVAALGLFGSAIVGRHHGFALRQPEVLQAISRALSHREKAVVRQVLPGPSHEVVHRVTVSAVGTGAMCLFQDISDQEQSEQMRRDFVANVSHELRTPLTSLLGFIETLRGPAKDDSAARSRFLAIMAAEAERMNRLVRDLLHLSRVEAQERQRPSAKHDMAALIRSAVQSLRPMAVEAGIELDCVGLDQPIVIFVDPDQMMQVVTNLVENAIKYGALGKRVRIELSRETGPRGPLVRLDVADRGEGIDPLHIPRLAERFYRVDGHRSREKGGTGLGLAIVKHIAHRHRGRLTIESGLGKGSTFSVILPAD
jgi:two-component system, OmpR family, phosphate regulon sensor histidine kinase PhoR